MVQKNMRLGRRLSDFYFRTNKDPWKGWKTKLKQATHKFQ